MKFGYCLDGYIGFNDPLISYKAGFISSVPNYQLLHHPIENSDIQINMLRLDKFNRPRDYSIELFNLLKIPTG
jgi:hypothetical protein